MQTLDKNESVGVCIGINSESVDQIMHRIVYRLVGRTWAKANNTVKIRVWVRVCGPIFNEIKDELHKKE